MRSIRFIIATFWAIAALGLASVQAKEPAVPATEGPETDPYLWLEEVDSERALDWVRARNDETFNVLTPDGRYERFKEEALDILTAKDRIPFGVVRGDYVYNFWQDEEHVRGLYRRTSLDSYLTEKPRWEIVLDFDALAEEEGKNWVYQGATVYPDDYSRALFSLSDGGKDASVLREFDLETKQFVQKGFEFPERKQSATWVDKDTLLVASPLNEEEVTESGYPRLVRRLARGQEVAEAPILFEGEKGDVSIRPASLRSQGRSIPLIVRSPSFFEAEYFTLDGDTPKRLPLPLDAALEGLLGDDVIVFLRSDWVIGDETFTQGSVVSFSWDAYAASGELPRVGLIYKPDDRSSVQQVAISKSQLFLNVLNNVTSEVLRFERDGRRWAAERLALPSHSSINLIGVSSQEEVAFAFIENFEQPGLLKQISPADAPSEPIKRMPPRFDAQGISTRQFEATSKDGTKVPYFLVRRAGAAGAQPTLIYGYGGFEVSLTPSYSGVMGKLWLEKGGAYVLANIRGGGEFGPAWHQAALKENRQLAYDDFIAIAEDLVARGLAEPKSMGIMGGSNGGLLVGATLTQRPDLYGAAIIQVPLLDMLRYHTLLAGASWMAEYGDPDVPEERAYIEKYSPYQNLNSEADYPLTFIYTSTRDDRVHPGHARKFAARMSEQGHDMLYFERIEGGHSAGANLAQAAERSALEFIYLHRQLMD